MSSSSPPQLPMQHTYDPQPRASRLIVSVKRSVSTKRHARSQSQSMHMYSTPQERSPSFHPASFREPPLASTRPTVEQIAMGLHVSRTPHLRQHSRSSSHSHRSSSSTTLPIPPRSSLKKSRLGSSSPSTSESSPALHTLPLPTSASASTSTITSASLHMITPAVNTPLSASSLPPRLQHSGNTSNALTALKLRMAKLLPGERKRNASSPALVISTDTTQKKAARKAVRFESLGGVD